MADLEQYKAKRDFTKTAEPAGKRKQRKARADGGRFVIHKHAARRLHYDLRLEHDGVLWSWAVTRGPSLDPSEKRLAVHVEDHPIDYGDFEGTIPVGEYGAGSVIQWEDGIWIPDGDADAGMKKGHLRFTLKGSKLNGIWDLVRLKPRKGETRDNWLLIKADDDWARPGEDVLEDAPASVKSGRTVEEIGAGNAPVWHSTKKSGKAAKPPAARREKAVGKRAGPTTEATIAFVPPCLARLEAAAPDGKAWLHEVKFDGYRMQAHIQNGSVKLFTRNGHDWTDRFGKVISEALSALDCDSAVIDGEIVALSDKGGTSFSGLQKALSEGSTDALVFYVFDLLLRDGQDLRGETLLERKADLSRLIGDQAGPLRYSEHFIEPGRTMLKHACRMGLEGVISKRADAAYHSGRGHDWIKSKCTQRQEFVIVGYLPSEKTGRGLRSLLVGYHEGDRLKPAGRVGTGFTTRIADDLKKRLDAIRSKTSPLDGAAGKENGVVWVKPDLVAEIEFRAWTEGGSLRHASFQGLREDKEASEVVAEHPQKAEDASDEKPVPRSRTSTASARSTVKLTNADKLLWPKAALTKQGLLDHYAQVWPRMERFVVNRPLSLLRAPDGVEGKQRFFQKHASAGMSDAIATAKDAHDGEDLLFIRDFDGLTALVQLGVVEIHIWGATMDRIETPDQIVFDLDPDEAVGADDVRKAALEIHGRLDELGLTNLVKTSGGKGYHIVVPLKPKADWRVAKTFAHDFAQAMEQSAPDRYTATLSKKARHGRIFIDYLRNGRGSTTVAPYSTRAKPDATVSVPIRWAELEGGVGPADFTARSTTLSKAIEAADPWANYDKGRHALKS